MLRSRSRYVAWLEVTGKFINLCLSWRERKRKARAPCGNLQIPFLKLVSVVVNVMFFQISEMCLFLSVSLITLKLIGWLIYFAAVKLLP